MFLEYNQLINLFKNVKNEFLILCMYIKIKFKNLFFVSFTQIIVLVGGTYHRGILRKR